MSLFLLLQNKPVTSPLTTSLASLVDISAEQRTIADLRFFFVLVFLFMRLCHNHTGSYNDKFAHVYTK